jgi:hypothetical protein
MRRRVSIEWWKEEGGRMKDEEWEEAQGVEGMDGMDEMDGSDGWDEWEGWERWEEWDEWEGWGDGARAGEGEREDKTEGGEERAEERRLRRRGSREAMFFTSVAQRRENRTALTRYTMMWAAKRMG